MFIKQPPPEEKLVEDKEASLDAQAIMGKDERNIATLAYALYEQRGARVGTIWMIGLKQNNGS